MALGVYQLGLLNILNVLNIQVALLARNPFFKCVYRSGEVISEPDMTDALWHLGIMFISALMCRA